jgi:hypothetical protein
LQTGAKHSPEQATSFGSRQANRDPKFAALRSEARAVACSQQLSPAQVEQASEKPSVVRSAPQVELLVVLVLVVLVVLVLVVLVVLVVVCPPFVSSVEQAPAAATPATASSAAHCSFLMGPLMSVLETSRRSPRLLDGASASSSWPKPCRRSCTDPPFGVERQAKAASHTGVRAAEPGTRSTPRVASRSCMLILGEFWLPPSAV